MHLRWVNKKFMNLENICVEDIISLSEIHTHPIMFIFVVLILIGEISFEIEQIFCES